MAWSATGVIGSKWIGFPGSTRELALRLPTSTAMDAPKFSSSKSTIHHRKTRDGFASAGVSIHKEECGMGGVHGSSSTVGDRGRIKVAAWRWLLLELADRRLSCFTS